MRVLEHGNSTQERRKFYFSFLARVVFFPKLFFKAWNKSKRFKIRMYTCGTYRAVYRINLSNTENDVRSSSERASLEER